MIEVFGIDVSHYQGQIDWKQVTADGKKFVIMKCQYEAQSHRKDEYFEANYKEPETMALLEEYTFILPGRLWPILKPTQKLY